MDDFHARGLDESNFGESAAIRTVQAFDYFGKTKPSYTERTQTGGVLTVFLIAASLWLASTEVSRWWAGTTTHEYAVEQGIGHDLQINLDVIVRMRCEDLHVNVQDASGDRILASEALTKDPTVWSLWTGPKIAQQIMKVKAEEMKKHNEYEEEDVHDFLGAAGRRGKKFGKTPRVPRGMTADACRVYGSLHGNKVQGDFHITARGHGYMEFGHHLDHDSFNFSHVIHELSFGPYYPTLTNPLDDTIAITPTVDDHFYKFQYYLSVVPTIYTIDAPALRALPATHDESPNSGSDGLSHHPKAVSRKTVFTNQYAVTEQNHPVPENYVPGIFVKYDIEPIMLMIAEEWASLPSLGIRIVNVISGVLVAGGWAYQLSEWLKGILGRRRRGADAFGMLNGEKKG
ncbi:ER-derived vesicles protein ERV41 [Teratosphaeria destructans]|uniref:Endoplasmic reticulum-Golgi intermediate compartment protein n=1 Tax=Teratosphaeria destructans TaxID=418781 RepID=A0A9W7W0U7_9PEZI|nr:ER-derived vesicles protein ERV41 [Teratosphaeria destructans]